MVPILGLSVIWRLLHPFDTTLGGAFVEIGNDREDMFINGVDEMQNKAFVRDRW